MRKISVFLVLVIVFSACAALFVSAVGYDVPKLVHEPATVTVKPGSKAVLKTVASGKDLHFSWTVEVYPHGTFDLSKDAGIKGLEKLDGSGKMKVSMKTYSSGTDEYTSELTIDGVIETNYGMVCTCTVANDSGAKDTDPASVYTSTLAPAQATVDLIAELDVRIGKLIKLACNVYPADEDYAGIEYRWYTTPDGDKGKAELLEGENDPVLIVDTACGGIYFYYCSIYILKGITDFCYESAVTMIRIHEPLIDVTYDKTDISLDAKETATLKANVAVDPESDAEGGELSYQWYKGKNNLPGTFEQISGATSDTLEVKGEDTAGKLNYYCDVTLTSLEGVKFSSLTSDTVFVTVISTGEEVMKITEQPKNVKLTENLEASFTVKATKAVSYEWFALEPGSGIPVKLQNGEGGVISGVDGETLKIKAELSNNGSSYFCKVSDKNGKTLSSDAALLEVTAEETKPEETKPEETKPEVTKPEETKPENTKTEETKPEETKPGANVNSGEKTLLTVIIIVICVLVVILIGIGIFVLIKFGKKKQ